MTPSCSSWSARKAAPRAATTARRRCGRSPRLRLTCKGGHYLGLGRWHSLHAALCRARLGRGRACLPQIFRHTANRAWVRGPCSGCACICHAACKVFPMCTGFCEACCRSRCRVQAQLKHPQVALRTSAFNNVQGRTRAHTCASKRSWARAQQCARAGYASALAGVHLHMWGAGAASAQRAGAQLSAPAASPSR